MGTVRTHHAGTLRADHEGDEVTLAGWVAASRDHGGIQFVDLRDASGVAQVVIDPDGGEDLAGVGVRLRDEFCIRVIGTVRVRPEGTRNPDLSSGDVEVAASSVEILATAAGLPFQIDDRVEIDEQRRLQYRYLDLRRPRMAANLKARSKALGAMRQTLGEMGFLEVETPTLIKSTPEGARDLLVPSRLRPGHFFAMPQSPQLFKQLLMVAGVERYFQVARCYRDEDFRADRQVEFTQLDLEGSFWEQDDVLATIEEVVTAVVKAVRGTEVTRPFERLTYAESMRRFGTDKPDLRFGMEIADLGDVFAATDFKAFASTVADGGVIRGINAGAQPSSRSALDGLVDRAKEAGAKGLVWMVVEEDGSLRSPVSKFLSENELAAVTTALAGAPGDVLLLVADTEKVASSVLGRLRTELGEPADPEELRFLWVVDFPVFEVGEDGSLAPAHHPFTQPRSVEEMASTPETAVAKAYDLVVNGHELGSGSVRIHDPEVQQQVFDILGISPDEAAGRFGWFLEALRYGTPPHAGFAIGFDRFLMVLQREPNIREVIPFPKTQTGADPLTASPSKVDEAQLQELGIQIRPDVVAAWEERSD